MRGQKETKELTLEMGMKLETEGTEGNCNETHETKQTRNKNTTVNQKNTQKHTRIMTNPHL